MYRSGWASKPNQECVLAVWIKRDGFDKILSEAYTPEAQKEAGKEDIMVRLQWDPDHAPNGDKEQRRAIQMGLKGEVSKWLDEGGHLHCEAVMCLQHVT